MAAKRTKLEVAINRWKKERTGPDRRVKTYGRVWRYSRDNDSAERVFHHEKLKLVIRGLDDDDMWRFSLEEQYEMFIETSDGISVWKRVGTAQHLVTLAEQVHRALGS